jgi:hypothetical protein
LRWSRPAEILLDEKEIITETIFRAGKIEELHFENYWMLQNYRVRESMWLCCKNRRLSRVQAVNLILNCAVVAKYCTYMEYNLVPRDGGLRVSPVGNCSFLLITIQVKKRVSFMSMNEG